MPRLGAVGAVGVAVGLGTATPAARLIRLALAVHRRERTFGACRGAGLLGAGAVSTAMTALVLPFLGAGQRPYAALGGLAVSAVLDTLGLLLLPGPAPTVLTRLRWALDGVCIGLSLFFAAWLLFVTPAGAARPVALAAALAASSGLAVTVLTVLRAARDQPTALLCGSGAGLGIAGLTMLTVAVAGGAPAAALVAAAAALVAAPVLAWYGVSHADASRTAPARPDIDTVFASYPLLSLPVALAAVAAVYHAVAVGKLDAPSLRLGVAVAAAVAIREMLAAIDVRRHARRLAAREAHFRSLVTSSSNVEKPGRRAFTDRLTGLPGRGELLRALATLRGLPGGTGAVLVIDLGGPGNNDVAGREVGEAVLIEVARRLRTGIGQDDVAARLGEAEFGVVTAGRPLEGYGLGVRLLAALTEAYRLPDATVHRTASIGLAEVTVRDSVDEIVHRAVLACRRAQQLGGERVEWYDGSLEALLLRRDTLERSLPGAAGRGELDVVYQPIVSLLDGRPVGVEALLRWRHPVLGTILPAEVMPVAEQVGATGEVGGWVVQTVCRQLGGWLREGRDIWVSVNVSVARLASYGFLAKVTGALNRHRVPADRFTVEVAESGVGAQIGRVGTQLARLRSLGVRTALDHFGAGRNSLAYLRQLPVDYLKIDSALFLTPPAGAGTDAGNATGTGVEQAPLAPLMDVVVGLGRRLGIEIIAGGLESEDQLELARAAGCRYGQGFLLGRPVPAEHIEAYLESYRTPSS